MITTQHNNGLIVNKCWSLNCARRHSQTQPQCQFETVNFFLGCVPSPPGNMHIKQLFKMDIRTTFSLLLTKSVSKQHFLCFYTYASVAFKVFSYAQKLLSQTQRMLVLNPEAQFIDPDWGYNVDPDTELSYRPAPAYVAWRAATTTLCQSRLFPPVRERLRIWPLDCCDVGMTIRAANHYGLYLIHK